MRSKNIRFYIIFIVVFLVMHITGMLAGRFQYIYNALISFSITFLFLVILDKWYSGVSFAAIVKNLGFHRAGIGNIAPGILVSIALLLTYPLLAWILNTDLVLHKDWILNLAGVCLTGGLMEEMFFRGFLFRHLRSSMTFKKAVWHSTVLFTIAHLMMFTYMPWPVALLSTILAIVMSAPLAYLFEKGENTVWGPAMVHATVRTIGLVITVPEPKFTSMSMMWMVGCMIVPWKVVLFYKDFRR